MARTCSTGYLSLLKQALEIAEEEKPLELPNGWEWTRLGVISVLGTGATPSCDSGLYYNPPEFNWCRVPCDYIPKRSYPLFRTRAASHGERREGW